MKTPAPDPAAVTLPLASLLDERLTHPADRQHERNGNSLLVGAFRGQRRGQGLEFEDLRPYATGDDIRRIDWKVSARRHALHTRLYREERDVSLTLAVDLRSVMFNGSAVLRAVRAGRLAARLAWQAQTAGMRTAFTVMTADAVHEVPARRGSAAVLAGCRLLADVFPAAAAHSRRAHAEDASLEPLLDRLADRGRLAGSIILISGMDHPGDHFDRQLGGLARQRSVSGLLIDDPLELDGLPRGHYAWQSDGRQQVLRLDRQGVQRLRRALARARAVLAERFRRQGARLIDAAHPAALRQCLESAGSQRSIGARGYTDEFRTHHPGIVR